jgi:hypothetical protein
MFEWKPPDPRFVALARRLEALARRWLHHEPVKLDPAASSDDEIAADPTVADEGGSAAAG